MSRKIISPSSLEIEKKESYICTLASLKWYEQKPDVLGVNNLVSRSYT